MNEYKQRQAAIALYTDGVKVASIARSLNRSRKWVYHWITRFKQKKSCADWFKDESKAPKSVRQRIDAELEHKIVSIRKELVNEKMAQIGAISIQYECERRGIRPIPEVWVINRIISKHGLNKQVSARKSPKDYPELFWHVHQMDLVGPRYIKGDGKFYSVNLIDTTTHSCHVSAVRVKSSENIVKAIAAFWESHGLPDALQMDNELAFRGSNRYPRSFGSVIRFALSQGVAVVFIPVAEPWRNGIIEKFNSTYQKRFLKAHTFESLGHLIENEKAFINFHNSKHRYSSQIHKTPDEARSLQLPPIHYKGTIHLPSHKAKTKIPLTQGCIFFIRFIRGDSKLKLPNEEFLVKDTLRYSYVVAEINIVNHSLVVRQNDEVVQIYPYDITAIDW